MPEAQPGRPPVSLTIPADPEHIVVARTTVAAVAAVAGATLDEVEDLRLAVSEASALLLDEARTGTVTVAVSHDEGGLLLQFSTGAAAGETRPGSDLAWILLEGLVDEVRWEASSTVQLTLIKHLSLGAVPGP